jgi:fermentation-respiration switch protein FrsA (DUF1100 family)
MHGTADSVIGFWHGEKLFQLANDPKQFVAVQGADHNDVSPGTTRVYTEALAGFAGTLDAQAGRERP